MNVQYEDVKDIRSKKHMQKKKIKQPAFYSELRKMTPNSNQTKMKRNKSSKRKVPFTRCLPVVILGLVCFFLFVTSTVLGFMVFQGLHKHQPQKLPLDNVTQENNCMFREEPLNTGNPCSCKTTCCGKKCYYFRDDLKTFEDSKKSCNEMNSTLLKIDDEKELEFILSQSFSQYWIGLSRKGESNIWTWEDGSETLLKKLSDRLQSKFGNCARIARGNVGTFDCTKFLPYVCEK